MEQKIKITEPAGSIRRMARAELRGHWKTAILVYILYSVLLSVPAALIEVLFGDGGIEARFLPGIGADGITGLNASFFEAFSSAITERQMRASAMSSLYTLITSGPLLLGLSCFLLALVRGAAHGTGMILDGFNNFFRAFGLFVLLSILVILWTLPVVLVAGLAGTARFAAAGPYQVAGMGGFMVLIVFSVFVVAVVALLAYSQAFFLLADEPRHGLAHALRRSRRLMSGNKAKLFLLTLSFIGWYLLSFLVLLIPSFFLSFAPYSVSLLLSAVLNGVVTAPVFMYMAASGAVFHDILTGRRRLLPLGPGLVAGGQGDGWGASEDWRPNADAGARDARDLDAREGGEGKER